MLKTLETHRRALHRIPEIGFDLPKTRAYVLEQLLRLNAAVEPAAGGGVFAFFDAKKAHTVAFRADMDALEIEEDSGCAFSSEHPGRMHACGHDAHMAMLLTLAARLDGNLDALPNNVLLIFQPAEESGGGGEKIAESGALERYAVRRIYAAHVHPAVADGVIASRPGPFMAASSEIHARFLGASAHAARWYEGRDALMAGVEFARAIDALDRSLPADMPRLLKLCRFRAGTATNIVADVAEIAGTVRAFSRDDHESLKQSIRTIASDAAAPHNVRAEVDFTPAYPPLVNDRAVYEGFLRAVDGMRYEELPDPDLTSEDFSFYLERVPGMMFYVGLGTGIPLHSPGFLLNERALLPGVEAFERLALSGA